MKKLGQKNQKVTKGTSSALVLSIAIHVGLFLLAGMLVVFTVYRPEEIPFEAPKAVERPKMKLKKPKVKVKKSSKPKATKRIVTKSRQSTMPDIELPGLGGIADGLDGELAEFDIPDFSFNDSLLGSEKTIGNDFVGTFYDLNRSYSGSTKIIHPGQFIEAMTKFVQGGWKRSSLSKYYRSEKKLYTTHFAIPPLHSTIAPRAFGEPDAAGYNFAVLYKGELVYKDDITFRFWGMGDDFITVRVDNEVVLHAPYPRNDWRDVSQVAAPWQSRSGQSRTHWLGCQLSVVGDWITLKAGEPLDMEVLIGEVPGGLFQAMLTVEVEGEEYPRNPSRNGPILPIFKTAMLPRDMVEAIHADLDPYDACVTNGPVFCDFDTTASQLEPPAEAEPVAAVEIVQPMEEKSPIRSWISRETGETHEAKYVTMIGSQVVLNTADGKKLTFSFSDLSEEDQLYLTLANPPVFNLNFSKSSSFVPAPSVSAYEGSPRPMQISDWIFGVKIKQSGTGDYPRELKVEYYVIGDEVDGNNFVLLDRQESTFVPADVKGKGYSFFGEDPIRTVTTAIRAASPMRGTRYGGYLIVLRNEKGEIIQHQATSKWLFEKLDKIKEIPVGAHFNKEGERVGPPRPGPGDRPSWI